MDTQSDTHINSLYSAVRKNLLTIFVGAGVSINSGFPSWNEVIQALAKDLSIPKDKIPDFTKLAQMYEITYKKNSLDKKIKSLFPKSAKPNSIHQAIFNLVPKYIITTNQDTLLEQYEGEIEKFYDIVVTDQELIDSELPKKIIKMHGDFKHHNIVFTEKDYLEYSYNFPIIENFIKSVLSTTFVLFIGYSYNDSTFKQINSWLRRNIRTPLPMYMLIHEDDFSPIESDYLKEHNIFVIKVGAAGHPHKEAIVDFLSKIQSSYSAFPSHIIPQNNIQREFFEEFSSLDTLNAVFYRQITSYISNSSIFYEPRTNKAFLQLLDESASYDQNTAIRRINQDFFENLKRYVDKQKKDLLENTLSDEVSIEKDNIALIARVLTKAGILGICNDFSKLESVEWGNNDFTSIDIPFFNFDYSATPNSADPVQIKLYRMFQYTALGKWQEALSLCKEAAGLAQQNKQYLWALIALFNCNTLNKKFFNEVTPENHKTTGNYDAPGPYPLDKIVEQMPYNIKRAATTLLKFLDFSNINNSIVSSLTSYKKALNDKKSREKGAQVLSNIGDSHLHYHLNIIVMALQNFILIEDYLEYKILNQQYLKIAIAKQSQDDTLRLSELEIYSCIRHCPTEDLPSIFEEFTNIENPNRTKKTLDLREATNWLLDTVWDNLAQQYSVKVSSLASYIKNTLYLLSISKLSQDQTNKILSKIAEFINNHLCTYDFFESVNSFIAWQYHLYSNILSSEKLAKILDSLLGKIICQKGNFLEYKAFTDEKMTNIYANFHETKYQYNNHGYIKRFIELLKNQPIKDQLIASVSVPFSLYQVSNDVIKITIKNYLTGLSKNPEVHTLEWAISFWYILLLKLDFFDMQPISEEQWRALHQMLKESLKNHHSSSTFADIHALCRALLNKTEDEDTKTQIENIINTLKDIQKIFQSF